jgi:hypothetical protein
MEANVWFEEGRHPSLTGYSLISLLAIINRLPFTGKPKLPSLSRPRKTDISLL